ncbi:chorismate mutase [Falsibacillus albus]|uniref:chorismate mutase n=1 Tax=Falsibacillus albus TaxID=2478915 RepID=A0A3L7K313_9BACI|nr:chorismate mutase [Falsibacillus albus]RLQ95102.1 chorismate mutase [Falsibacillus albus]
MLRGIRGATTVEKDSEQEILLAAKELIQHMISANKLEADQVASIFISATRDLTTAFPAKAARDSEEWKYVPVMCVQELEVAGGLERCIRIMMHVNTNVSQKEVQHVYLRKAMSLRPDLLKEKN